MDPTPEQHNAISLVRQRSHELCAALSPALFGWAHLRLREFPGVQTEPEDIVQETWLRALASVTADASRLEAPEAFRAWLFGIARNVLLEELRRGRVAARSPADGSMYGLGLLADTATSICTGLGRHETVKVFLDFAEKLDDLDSQLLVHCAFEDVTASDVGRRLGVEPGTAIKRWQRLREHLQTSCLGERLGLGA